MAEGCGTARALSCAYHGWVYRLDGSLARAAGMEGVEGFAPEAHHLCPVAVAAWARFVFVNPDPTASPLLNHACPREELDSCIARIRAGFRRRDC